MGGEKKNLRWGVERRLEFIEFRLFWEGRVNRSDLIEKFGISINQASGDLSRYLGVAPGNLIYDKSARTYLRGPEFEPVFLKPDASRYLSQIRSMAEGILDADDSWIGLVPEYDAAPTPVRGVDAKKLRIVIAAIRRNEAVEVKYQSLSSPEPRWRWITPHAIAFDGFRWHARAWCEESGVFKDFLLSRILEAGSTKTCEISPDVDHEWTDEVILEIGPHPALSDGQKKVVELDYGMTDGKSKIRVRRAMLYYALKRLGLDTPSEARKPQDQQIVLLTDKAILSDSPFDHFYQGAS
ncbi:MAG: WYL domain-containing protein [Sphingomonadales bacterium]